MIKRHSIQIFLFLLLCLPALAQSGNRVRYVYDGDTVLLENGECVRYLGVDTPETGNRDQDPEFMAEAARTFNVRAVEGKQIRLEFDRDRRDRYDRLLAYVYLQEEGRMLNVELLKRGLGRVMTIRPNVRHRDTLIQAQRDAMSRGSGIWSRRVDTGGGPYLGSRRSYRFHRPDCAYAERIHARNRIRFETRRQAFWKGYSPCSRCNP